MNNAHLRMGQFWGGECFRIHSHISPTYGPFFQITWIGDRGKNRTVPDMYEQIFDSLAEGFDWISKNLHVLRPVKPCLRCGGSGFRSHKETMGSPGDWPCPACSTTKEGIE